MGAPAIEQLVTILTAAAGVQTLVAGRVSPLLRVQAAALPAVTLQRISLVPSNSFQGNAQLDIARIQIDSWGATYTDARAVATAVRAAMDAASILMDSEQDGSFEEEAPAGVFRVIQEYLVFS